MQNLVLFVLIMVYVGVDRNLGAVVWYEDIHNMWNTVPHYIVIRFSKCEPGKGVYVLRNEVDESDIIEVEEKKLVEIYKLVPPPFIQTRWERYQDKPIFEGVWMKQASIELQTEVIYKN